MTEFKAGDKVRINSSTRAKEIVRYRNAPAHTWASYRAFKPNEVFDVVEAYDNGNIRIGSKAGDINETWEATAFTKVGTKSPARPHGKQEYRGNGKHSWEAVTGTTVRLRVPGGWLYGRLSTVNTAVVRDTVFVPTPEVIGYKI